MSAHLPDKCALRRIGLRIWLRVRVMLEKLKECPCNSSPLELKNLLLEQGSCLGVPQFFGSAGQRVSGQLQTNLDLLMP